MFSKILAILFFLAFVNAQDACCVLTSTFLNNDFGLRDGSIATCGNIHLLKSSGVNGSECAYGKIDHKDDVNLYGNAFTNQEFVSGQGSWVYGDVVSAGSIKTKPKDWSWSITGNAQENTQVTDNVCTSTYGVCLFQGDFVPIPSAVKQLNETSQRKKLLRQQNIHVPNGQSYTWTPGTYGKVDFGYQSVITVNPGVYIIDHLEIKNQVTFNFADLSGDCGVFGGVVFFYVCRSIDIERDFKMTGMTFGGDGPCFGNYGVLWASLGDISIKQTKYPFYGAVVANQKIDVERLNTVNGCLAGLNGVDIKTGVTINKMGGCDCTCIDKK